MDLEEQLRVIVEDAVNYGVPSVVAAKAIAPVLGLFAQQLQHEQYYILQNLEGDWVVTTIANPQIQEEQRVIYAFVSVQDAATFRDLNNPDLVAVPMPIAQLLFRIFALQTIDSLIVLEDSQNLNRGVKIEQKTLAQSIQQQIEQLGNIASDLA